MSTSTALAASPVSAPLPASTSRPRRSLAGLLTSGDPAWRSHYFDFCQKHLLVLAALAVRPKTLYALRVAYKSADYQTIRDLRQMGFEIPCTMVCGQNFWGHWGHVGCYELTPSDLQLYCAWLVGRQRKNQAFDQAFLTVNKGLANLVLMDFNQLVSREELENDLLLWAPYAINAMLQVLAKQVARDYDAVPRALREGLKDGLAGRKLHGGLDQ